MIKKTEAGNPGKSAVFDILLFAALLGSAWGLSEALAGGTVRSAGLPMRAGILTGIGMLIMGFGLGAGLRPGNMLLVAAITAATMQLAVPVLNCSFLCRANSGLAVIFHGTSLAAVLFAAGRFGGKPAVRYGIAGVAAAGLSALAFHTAGPHLAPCDYLLSFTGEGGLASFMWREGAVWAAFSAVLLPTGVAFGERALRGIARLRLNRPGAYYGTAAASISLCLVLIVLSIQRGF